MKGRAPAPPVLTCVRARFNRFLAASVFSLTYYFAPLYVLSAPLALFRAPMAQSTWLYLAPMVISAVLPCTMNAIALSSWPARWCAF
jgi:hypothetical protein